MLFNKQTEDEKCSSCGKRFKDLVGGSVICLHCEHEAERELAEATVLGHLWMALCCLFNLQFAGMFVEIVWAIQRLTSTGYYGKNGRFTRILKTKGPK